jgi:fumarate hydratase, class I
MIDRRAFLLGAAGTVTISGCSTRLPSSLGPDGALDGPSAFFDSVLDLVIKTSADLPPDVRAAMRVAQDAEPTGTLSAEALTIIAKNVDQAAEGGKPMCQDTGLPTFAIKAPVGTDQVWIAKQIDGAIAEATTRGTLRPNSVDSITSKNSGNNLGLGTPVLHFEQGGRGEIEVRLLLKGGGCENCNATYSVPCELTHLGHADRDLEGVRKCILHAIWKAQGQGCSPGVVGVCVGGDYTSGAMHAKQQLFRTVDDVNPDPTLATLEASIKHSANDLGIGTMGFGGRTTLIGCKIGALNRLPASFFISVAYNCWAFRRLGVVLDARTGAIKRWLYRDPSRPPRPMLNPAAAGRLVGNVRLKAPLDERAIRSLKVGDVVLVSGRMYTARDLVHKYLMNNPSPVDLRGAVLYHCGPVILKEGGRFRMLAAGPTTSIREESYQSEVIRRYGVRAVIGKGGMGAKTLRALKDFGAVYLSAIGGAAQFYAKCVERIDGVSLEGFGVPEAMWHLEVIDFPCIVTMDALGHSLHTNVEEESGQQLAATSG